MSEIEHRIEPWTSVSVSKHISPLPPPLPKTENDIRWFTMMFKISSSFFLGDSCPFVISAPGNVKYAPIAVPKGGDIIHQGAVLSVENTDEIMVSFKMISTYLTSKYFC